MTFLGWNPNKTDENTFPEILKWSKSFPGVNSFLDSLCNVADNHSHSRASPKSELPTRFHLSILIATNCLTPARGSTGVLFRVCQQIDYVELSHALFQPIGVSHPVTVLFREVAQFICLRLEYSRSPHLMPFRHAAFVHALTNCKRRF